MTIKFYCKFFTNRKEIVKGGDLDTNRLNKKGIVHRRAKFSKRRHYSDAIQVRILVAMIWCISKKMKMY